MAVILDLSVVFQASPGTQPEMLETHFFFFFFFFFFEIKIMNKSKKCKKNVGVKLLKKIFISSKKDPPKNEGAIYVPKPPSHARKKGKVIVISVT